MNYETKLFSVDRNKEINLEDAAGLLRKGELVAFPTETVYGLGGNALDPTASKRIYEAKGRPSDNPLIVHIADFDAIKILGRDVSEKAMAVAKKFWPGPLTIIVKKSELVPKETTGGLDTVALRMPSDEIARELIKQSGLYIAAPSANKSGRPSTTRAEHCMEDLAGKIPMVIDGGAVKIGLESTIVDMSGDKPLILRPGFITKEQLEEVIPEVDFDPAVIAKVKSNNIVAKAPGMKYRHYAPKGELVIYEGAPQRVIEAINEEAKKLMAEGKSVAVLATEESKDFYEAGQVISLGRRQSEEEIAAHLFDTLRHFDDIGAEYIYAESFYGSGVGQAIMNRLLKAAGYRIYEV